MKQKLACLVALIPSILIAGETVSLSNGKDLEGWTMDVPARDKLSEATDIKIQDGALIHASTPRRLYDMFPQLIEIQMQHEHAGDFWCIGENIEVPDMEKLRPRKDPGQLFGGKSTATSGRIALQAEGSEVEFRKMRTRPDPEMNRGCGNSPPLNASGE